MKNPAIKKRDIQGVVQRAYDSLLEATKDLHDAQALAYGNYPVYDIVLRQLQSQATDLENQLNQLNNAIINDH